MKKGDAYDRPLGSCYQIEQLSGPSQLPLLGVLASSGLLLILVSQKGTPTWSITAETPIVDVHTLTLPCWLFVCIRNHPSLIIAGVIIYVCVVTEIYITCT